MELSTLLPLLIAIFIMFFIVMRYLTRARIWNLFAILSIIALTTYFDSIVTMVITLVVTILWLGYDTFFND